MDSITSLESVDKLDSIIDNPFISRTKITYYDDKTDEQIDITNENIHKYYKSVYILVKVDKIKIPSDFYKWQIDKTLFDIIKKKLIIYQMKTTILNNKSHYNNILVLSNEQLQEFNIFNYDLENKNIVIPILNIEFNDIIQYLQQYEDNYTLKKLYNVILLNQYFTNTKKKDITEYILTIDDTNSWTNPHFMNISTFFKNRDFTFQYKKVIDKQIASFYKKELDKTKHNDDEHYLHDIKKYYCTIFDSYIFSRKTDITTHDINSLFDTCSNKEKYMLFFSLMINKRYSHLVINNQHILTIM